VKKPMKKKHFNSKVKTKSLTVMLVLVFLLSVLVGTQFIGEVSAAIVYTEYTGTLSGGDWALRIPDPWNGMLVVGCRGYAGPTTIPSPSVSSTEYRSILDAGFAVAASNFGVAGVCVLEGVDSTYELTMHLIDNYGVAGKVFLVGWSMGGAVALLLGEKYPDVYSGVLDMYGSKDMKDNYRVSKLWANLTDGELAAELTALGIPVPPPGFSLASLRSFHAMGLADLILATGGTPTSQPKAYEDSSPTYHADIMIPVITVHGTADPIVPHYQSDMYKAAVAKAYRSYLYRLYNVTGAGHGTGDIAAETIPRFNELVEWSNELTGAHDWPMFQNDPQHSGYSTSNAPNTNQTLWISTVGSGTGLPPAIVNGKLYLGAHDKNIYCFDAATGEKIWNYTTGGMIVTSPSVADGKVYIGSMDGKVYCLDAATGAKIWSFTTSGGAGAVVADGKVYANSEDGVYCLRADWGQSEWVFTTGDAVTCHPAVADGKIYFGSLDKKIYCVGAASGALIWSYTTGDRVECLGAAVADGKVYIGSDDDKVYCLDAATGAKIWSSTTGGDIHSSPAVAYGKVYVGSLDKNLYCLDPATGAVIWTYTTGNGVWGPPTVADGKVYAGSQDRKIYCLDAETGAFIWSYTTNSILYSSPIVANGVAYGVSGTNVYAFSAWQPIPEGITLSVMLLLSTIAVIVSMRYYRKRPKWQNW
jgi:outer membrane protein assembly factor BamB/fermentation-respiration switch protein FrsA (DUF1100 family)